MRKVSRGVCPRTIIVIQVAMIVALVEIYIIIMLTCNLQDPGKCAFLVYNQGFSNLITTGSRTATGDGTRGAGSTQGKEKRNKYGENGLQISQSTLEIVDYWNAKIPSLARMPKPQILPTESHPFMFFHLRKAGGSSRREEIVEAANLLGLPRFVPMYDVSAETYRPPPNPRLTDAVLFAGHFYWPSFEKFQNIRVHSHMAHVREVSTDGAPNFSCVTQIRPTVERVVSCWNFRFIQDAKAKTKTTKNTSLSSRPNPTPEVNLSKIFKPSYQLSTKDWREMLPKSYSQFSEGCNNEFARIFSSVGDAEDVVNLVVEDSAIFPLVLNETLNRMSKCVVLAMDGCTDNKLLISYYFPWLAPFYDCNKHVNRGTIKPHREVSVSDSMEILRQNLIDDIVYHHARNLHKEQVKYVKNQPKRETTPLEKDLEDVFSVDSSNDFDQTVTHHDRGPGSLSPRTVST